MGKWAKHLVIPDTQVKPGLNLDHLRAAGRYIAEKAPDVVVHLGDHWDFPSLSKYDRGKKAAEGRRVLADIEAGNEALEVLTKEIKKRRGYKPRLVLLRGNHEDRLSRAIEEDAKLEGVVGFHLLNDKKLGWQVVDYLVPVNIGGIWYCHYFYNPRTGRPWGGDARYKLKQIHGSFTQGHVQGLDQCQIPRPGRPRIRGLVAGSFYQHEEVYIGPQGNNEWRGLLVCHEIREGDYDLMEVSLGYLLRKYN